MTQGGSGRRARRRPGRRVQQSGRNGGSERTERRGSERTERRGSDGPPLPILAVGLGGAAVAFTATFRGPRERFWQRMTSTGLGLGGFALIASAPARRARLRPWHVPIGLASAGILYLTFRFGDRLARRFVPGGDRQIREIYALRTLRPRAEIATRLATIVGPAEELFWRGFVQAGLTRRYGRWRGAAYAIVAYGGVHIVTGNFTLMGAAGVAGAHWSVLYAAGVPLGALIVSHSAWDVWIFLVQPTGEIEAFGPNGATTRVSPTATAVPV